MAVTVPQRREGESELDHLRRKEVAWGLWQADALERMEQQDQTIEAMQARVLELEGTLSAAKDAAEAVAKLVGYGLHIPSPDDLARDMCGHINLMGGLHGDPDYLKGGKLHQTCRHVDLRSKAPRKAKDHP
jgi:hypothetical protein